MILEGTFREDLYYRLNVVQLEVPPLRERKNEIENLIEYFIAHFAKKYSLKKKISQACIKRLESYSWPGNVRELRNVIGRLMIMSESDIIQEKELDFLFSEKKRKHCSCEEKTEENEQNSTQSLSTEYKSYERQKILDTLKECNGNKSKAAKMLGMSRCRLYAALEK